jgi:hypothetical protein
MTPSKTCQGKTHSEPPKTAIFMSALFLSVYQPKTIICAQARVANVRAVTFLGFTGCTNFGENPELRGLLEVRPALLPVSNSTIAAAASSQAAPALKASGKATQRAAADRYRDLRNRDST